MPALPTCWWDHLPVLITGVLRSTQDIDLVISANLEQITQLVRQLQAMGYYAEPSAAVEALKRQLMVNVIDNKTGWKIDLMIRKSTLFGQEAFAAAGPSSFRASNSPLLRRRILSSPN